MHFMHWGGLCFEISAGIAEAGGQMMKKIIDVDIWIKKLNKIINDPEAPGEIIDYYLNLINEIEAEYEAQEGKQ